MLTCCAKIVLGERGVRATTREIGLPHLPVCVNVSWWCSWYVRLGNWLAPVVIATPDLVHEVAGGLHRLRGERQKGIIAADEEKHSDHRGVARRRAQSRESMQRVQHARIRLSANGTVRRIGQRLVRRIGGQPIVAHLSASSTSRPPEQTSSGQSPKRGH